MKMYPTYHDSLKSGLTHIWIGKQWFALAECFVIPLKLVNKKYKRTNTFKRIKYEVNTIKSTTIKPRS